MVQNVPITSTVVQAEVNCLSVTALLTVDSIVKSFLYSPGFNIMAHIIAVSLTFLTQNIRTIFMVMFIPTNLLPLKKIKASILALWPQPPLCSYLLFLFSVITICLHNDHSLDQERIRRANAVPPF